MKKMKYIIALLVLALLFTGCSKEDEEKKGSFAELKEEVNAEITAAKEGKYENLNVLCHDARLPETDELKVMRFPVYTFTKEMTLSEKLEFYRDVVFPKLLDVDTVEEKHIVDTTSYDFDTKTFSRDYAYMMEHSDELEDSAHVGYNSNEQYKRVETIPEGICFNISLGTLGKVFGRNSPFVYGSCELVKTYNCYTDDLSDSYLLMDGTQKTIAEGKAEIEAYLNSHYPLVDVDNGVRNEVYEIEVKKVPGTEYYIFDAGRTFSYEGIRVKEHTGAEIAGEEGVMAEAILCESNKVDITVGLVNCFEKGIVARVYEEYLPFAEVMETVSFFMTQNTKFDVLDIAIEYRMFSEVVEEKEYYNWIPYWSFLMENPNDDSLVRVYVNIETGEVESY